jgi:hypothetical protein
MYSSIFEINFFHISVDNQKTYNDRIEWTFPYDETSSGIVIYRAFCLRHIHIHQFIVQTLRHDNHNSQLLR